MQRALIIVLALALAGHAAASGARWPRERWSRLDARGNYMPVGWRLVGLLRGAAGGLWLGSALWVATRAHMPARA